MNVAARTALCEILQATLQRQKFWLIQAGNGLIEEILAVNSATEGTCSGAKNSALTDQEGHHNDSATLTIKEFCCKLTTLSAKPDVSRYRYLRRKSCTLGS